MILYFGLWIINVLYVIRRKTNNIICLLSLALLTMLFVSNTGLVGDAEIYRNHFVNPISYDNTFEPGYTFVEIILQRLDVHTYTILLITLFSIALFFVWIGLRKYICSYHYIFAITMPFIFPTYATAIRFFVASAIMIAAIRFLNEKKYLIFVLLVLLASLFHMVSIFYLVFLFCGGNRVSLITGKKEMLLWLIFSLSIIIFIVSIVTKKSPIIMILIRFVNAFLDIGEIKLESYTSTSANWGAVMFMIVYLAGLATAIATKRIVFRSIKKSEIIEVEYLKSYVSLNYNINLMLSMILPFIAMNLIFYRIIIIGQVSNAIAIGMYRAIKNYRMNGYIIVFDSMTLLFVVSCFLWFIPEFIEINGISVEGIIEASHHFLG